MKQSFVLSLLLLASLYIDAQNDSLLYQEIDYDKRKKTFVIGTVVVYGLGSTALYFAWYDDFEQGPFHFYNDWDEWISVDKAGHVFSTYAQSECTYREALWAGYSDSKAMNIGVLSAFLYQSTIEIMDGFSEGWGFSVSDFGANIIGAGSWYAQQKAWNEQRIKLKFSYTPVSYDNDPLSSESGLSYTSLNTRAEDLYGTNFMERVLKDYNAQTLWASFDIKALTRSSVWPSWLNLAFGYGAENMYGGYHNQWEINDENYSVNSDLHPRYRQYVLALDYNLGSVKAKSPFVRTLFDVLDFFKWPAPAIEYSSNGEWSFHLVFLH